MMGSSSSPAAAASPIPAVTAASFINHGTVSLSGPYPDAISAASIVNDGLIIASVGRAIEDPIGPGASFAIAGPVSGTGMIEIASGNGVFALDQAGPGQIIHFDGGRGGGLTLSPASLDGGGVFEATLANFTAADAIFFSGTITHAAWSDGLPQRATAELIIAELKLAGSYSGANFTLTAGEATTRVQVSGASASVLHGFNSDSFSDFLIQNTAGVVVVGEVLDAQSSYAQIGALGHEWTFAGSGDFLGVGKSGFLVENTAGAVEVGELAFGQASYVQVGNLGPE